MSMFLAAIEKENTKHTDAGGTLGEITVKKVRNVWEDTVELKINVCVDGSGNCIGLMKPFADLMNQ